MRMNRPVPSTTVKKRAEILHDLGDAKRLAFHNKQIGTTLSVLFESDRQDGYRHGTTPNFTKVAVAATDNLWNQIKPITITAATDRWTFGHMTCAQAMNSAMTLL